jgi:phosphoribosylformimino-5-aminoimidazole carboxamide ribotide isomerase
MTDVFQPIPAVDIRGGRCVQLVQGDFARETAYGDDPSEMARYWQDAGAGRLHVVDLDGARDGIQGNAAAVAKLLGSVRIPVQVGGGVRSLETARTLLDLGADRVVVGTAAWPDPAPWFELGEALVLAIDVRDGELRTKGWTDGTGLTFDEAAARAGGARALVTAIDRDGTLAGPDLELVARAAHAGLKVVAAGGIRTPDDIEALAAAGAEAAVVGRALLYSPATSRRTKTR